MSKVKDMLMGLVCVALLYMLMVIMFILDSEVSSF